MNSNYILVLSIVSAFISLPVQADQSTIKAASSTVKVPVNKTIQRTVNTKSRASTTPTPLITQTMEFTLFTELIGITKKNSSTSKPPTRDKSTSKTSMNQNTINNKLNDKKNKTEKSTTQLVNIQNTKTRLVMLANTTSVKSMKEFSKVGTTTTPGASIAVKSNSILIQITLIIALKALIS